MQSSKHFFQPWSTSSFGDDATDLSAVELIALGDHLGLCRSPSGGLFALHCLAEGLHRFITSRFVTTMVIAVLLLGLTALVL